MIVTGPGRDGTRLGLIPRANRCRRTPLHLYEGGSSAHGPPFFAGATPGGTCRSKDRRYKTVAGVSPESKRGLKSGMTGIVTQCQLSKSVVRN